MGFEYSAATVGKLEERFRRTNVHRPMRVERYEAGTELTYDVTGVFPANSAEVGLIVEKFVGGGFAGQVYRVKITEIDSPQGRIEGLEVGGIYAMKILVPPSRKSQAFRDFIYRVGFQSPFSLQVNPSAARSGALWQKFIRRGAGVRFGAERAVVDIYATFIDTKLGSCGEISEWIDGRTWKFEVDDRLLERWKIKAGQEDNLCSPEYRAKKTFMTGFVKLLGEMGAFEFARQYEWWTCKSQPNVLKRFDAGDEPAAGLTAVDFRAGLALLPLLPMSPGDVPLIFKGLRRGSLVQFDRGDLNKLEGFIEAHSERFADMQDALGELKAADRKYRQSQIDVTHNHVRLLYSGKLWSNIFDAAVTGWSVRKITDQRATAALRSSRVLTLMFAVLGLIPTLGVTAGLILLITALVTGRPLGAVIVAAAGLGLIGPAVVMLLRRCSGRADYSLHYRNMLTSPSYFLRASRARIAETLIRWMRAGRLDGQDAMKIADQPWRFFIHLPLSLLPVFLHRILTDRRYAADRLRYIFVRPVQLYFNQAAREQWLNDMLVEGKKHHMLSDEDADRIMSRIGEPFIQKYLKSLAVHVCTLPITQIVSVIVAIVYIRMHPELSWQQGSAAAGAILVAFQIIPISPGSLARGLYVLYLVIRERNFKDYNIAVFLGFIKYIGYLSFPIQMAYRYPVLARFMAAHWATAAVRIVPVFGEHGALLEHGVFDLFYNYPLSVRRKMTSRAEYRTELKPRSWHAAVVVLFAVGTMAITAVFCRSTWGALPTLSNIWAFTIGVPLIVGCLVTIGAGGTKLSKRLRLSIVSGLLVGVGYSAAYATLGLLGESGGAATTNELLWTLVRNAMLSMFIFMLLAALGTLLTEINLPARSNDFEKPVPQEKLAGDVGVDTGHNVVEQDAPAGP